MSFLWRIISARLAMGVSALARTLTSTEGEVPAGNRLPGKIELAEQARRSQMVVRGRVRKTHALRRRNERGEDLIVTLATLEVRECLKGQLGATLDLLVEGGTVNGITMRSPGIPGVSAGDELVVFAGRFGDEAAPHRRGLRLLQVIRGTNRIKGGNLTWDELRDAVRRTLPIPP